jgi:hypothetical protein
VHGPDEDDVVEQGGRPLLPEWARRHRWLPSPGGWLSRGAALFALATLIVGLAAGMRSATGTRGSRPVRRRRQRQRRPPQAPTTCSGWPRRENGQTDTTNQSVEDWERADVRGSVRCQLLCPLPCALDVPWALMAAAAPCW